MMRDIRPTPPQNLNPYARELLEAFAGHPEAVKTRFLDTPQQGAWKPVMIETLCDNVASKMAALVERGAPRDLRDIYELCTRQILSIEECWRLWKVKNPELDTFEGRAKVLFHVERLELQRPLEKITTPDERASATALRQWFKTSFCAGGIP
jgi:hypothetical protein